MTLKFNNSLFLISSITTLVIFLFILTSISIIQDSAINKQFSINNQQTNKIKEIFADSDSQLKQSNETQLTETYTNKYYGIQFEYPSTADLIEDPILTSSYSQLGYVFFEGIYKLPYLIIKFYPLSPIEQTLDNFTSRFVKEKQIPGILNSSINILNSNSTYLAGNLAHQLEYIEEPDVRPQNNSNYENIQSKILSIWTINGNQAYVIQFKGSNENYEKYLQEAKIIINSFKIK
ncbi:MAG: hypothetical protein R3321_10990 [Nitrososphaeraceae archaeon]|nr:hypothetical protein [Nitrososphaeraceae archaeon]